MFNGLSISDQKIRDKHNFLVGFLQDKVDEGNFSQGSFLNETIIRPMAYILALIESEGDQILASQTVSKLGEVENETATQVLDNLASNWFISRKDSERAQGTVTVVVSSNDSVVIEAGTLFTKSQGVEFEYAGEEPLIFSPSDLTVELDSNGVATGNFTFDVIITGVVGFVGALLSPGIFESMDPQPSGFIRCFNKETFSDAGSEESNYSLAARLKTALTSRSFLTRDSIRALLVDEISACKAVNIIGASDPEMYRDVITLSDSSTMHTLGMVNVYPNCGFTTAKDGYAGAAWTSGSYSRSKPCFVSLGDTYGFKSTLFAGTSDELVLYDNYEVSSLTAANSTPIINNASSTLSFSNSALARTKNESFTITIAGTAAAGTFDAVTLIPTGLTEVETLAYSDSTRVASSDLLVYSPTVKYCEFAFSYISPVTTPGDFPTSNVKETISSFINNKCSSYEELSLDRLISYVTTEYASYISAIDLSTLSLKYRTLLPNGNIVWFKVSKDTSYSESKAFYIRKYSVNNVVTEEEIQITWAGHLEDYFKKLQVSDTSSCLFIDAASIEITEV